jgi:hypothetical protein
MNITEDYLSRAELWMIITIVTYFLINGAQIFETAVFVPKWTANPPGTFSLLANKNGTSLKTLDCFPFFARTDFYTSNCLLLETPSNKKWLTFSVYYPLCS